MKKMKNYLFIIATFITSVNLLSQTTYVPDDNFEQTLIDQGYDSGALDDYVPTANINVITILDIGGKNIADLTGIEDFTALTDLYCWVNNISLLDMSGNPNLVYLEARENQITTVNVSSNPNLEFLRLDTNNISSINLSSNPNLETLSLSNNNLSNIDLTSNLNLGILSIHNNTGLSSVNISANTQLIELYINKTNISSLNLNSNINLVNLDISNTFLAGIDLSLNVNLEILSSIEVPTITSLDLSTCTNFRRLWHENGNLSSLILPDINTIEWLLLSNNNLTSVDFVPDANVALELLYLQGNQITEIDLSSKGTIFWLRVNNIDGLTSLDIRDTNVNIMYADENPDLTCIFVNDANWASLHPDYVIDGATTFVETEAECDDLLSTIDIVFAGTTNIFPNPTKGIINILSDDNNAIKKISVYNSLGQFLFDNQNDKMIDISTFPKGIYFVNIKNKNGKIDTFKVVKK